MKKQKPLPVLPETTLAYLAGLFDGEGCVHIAKVKQHAGGINPSFILYVTVANTDRRIVDYIHALFGGNIKLSRATKPNHRDYHTWRASSLLAVRFLASIHRFCIIKTDQIALALEFSELMLKAHYRIEGEALARREAYRSKLSKMKGMLFNRATNEAYIQ